MMRIEYEMSESDYQILLKELQLSDSNPTLALGKCREFWKYLSAKMGFKATTAYLHPRKGSRCFTAEPEPQQDIGAHKFERFARAFSSHAGYCRHQCECGREYYSDDDQVDWEAGENEALEASGAILLDHIVTTLYFEGVEYVEACDCWHLRAKKLMDCIDSHAYCIAEYLNGEKAAAIKAAEKMPVVRGNRKGL